MERKPTDGRTAKQVWKPALRDIMILFIGLMRLVWLVAGFLIKPRLFFYYLRRLPFNFQNRPPTPTMI
jgi:hypothetical protein